MLSKIICQAPWYMCRPHEGSARFNVELSAMSSPAYDGRPSQESRLLARSLERNLRDSGMLDMEALCVAAGRKVGPYEDIRRKIWLKAWRQCWRRS